MDLYKGGNETWQHLHHFQNMGSFSSAQLILVGDELHIINDSGNTSHYIFETDPSI